MKLRDFVGGLEGTRFSDVYKHYRGENLPDQQFFDNALVDTFHLPQEKFLSSRRSSLRRSITGKLLEEHNGKFRVLDVSQDQAHRRTARIL